MKKTLCLILAFVVILTAFAGCSGKKSETEVIDLTAKSGEEAYAEIFKMIGSPDDYKGKTVKVRGEFEYADDEATGVRHYSCMVSSDEDGKQGIEFTTAEELDFVDYPVILSEIEVEGTVDTYNIGNTETLVVYLKNAKIKEV
ncbi:MAG: hypothetical protein IJ643_04980 [Eubacterium sp.]|nr:hypothetical protein [Eubacterium sp.]